MLLILALSFFLQSADKPNCYYRVDSKQHAMIRGKVITNEREACDHDLQCYLAIECDGKKHNFVYNSGETQVPPKILRAMESVRSLSEVKLGDWVEAEGEIVPNGRFSIIYLTKLKILADK